MALRLVKVRRLDVVACMTCPLCSNLLVDATTISICLHTFCRKCIYKKLSDEECDTCPVCDINLGGDPVDKLRPDHNLQDIRVKIFPIKRRMADPPAEAAPSVSPPAKRKERSLSSLVVSAPRVPAQAGVTGRRARVVMRKSTTSRGSSSSTEEVTRKEEHHIEGTSSPETLNDFVQNKKLAYSSKSTNNQIPKEAAGNSSAEKNDNLWKPLDCLVEAANRRTKFPKSKLLGPPTVKAEQYSTHVADINSAKPDLKENELRREAQDDKTNHPSVPSPVKRKRRPPNQNTTAASGDSSNSQLVVEYMRHQRQNVPIWFSLVASEDEGGAASLPQISSGFLRIKNGDMPVSSIQKYVAQKLELANVDEVQIMCQGKAVLPRLLLRNLLEMWLGGGQASRRVKTKVGGSGKDFVMVLTYSRRVRGETQVQQPPEIPNSSYYTKRFTKFVSTM